MSDRPYILVTNDDGIHAKGLAELIEVMRLFGDIAVIAPEVAMSGMSNAITADKPLRAVKLSEEPGIAIYKCNGTPVDCVKLGFNHPRKGTRLRGLGNQPRCQLLNKRHL